MDAVKKLIPPHEGDERVWRWRLAVAGFIGVNAMATTVHIAWACGLLTSLGLQGFAKADEFADTIKHATEQRVAIEQKLDAVQTISIQNAIKESLKIRCVSILQKNQAALDSSNRDLEQLEDSYYTLTKRNFNEPPCSVVLIAKGP